ncbi:MAG: CHAT domain-containing protein [Acidobacteriota bacterium]|nr:CHAT domain-containing protein [Acidobacteriota bacterium]
MPAKDYRRRPGRAAAVVLAAVALVSTASAGPVSSGRTIRVPQDYRLISLAVAAARPGDAVEVDDGYYFEKNIVLDEPISLRSRNLFGAVIYGSSDPGAAVFIVRAAVDVSGFILRDSCFGILQRDSPDVEWTGRDLAFFGMETAVRIDDRRDRVGSARLTRIIIDRCVTGAGTNEARRVWLERCLVLRTNLAFYGENHDSFWVDKAVLWDCRVTAKRSESFFPNGGTSKIVLGGDVRVFSPRDARDKKLDFPRAVNRLFLPEQGEPAESPERSSRRDALLLTLVGRAFLDGGSLAAAEAHFRLALSLAESSGVLEARWRADLGLAQTAAKRGDVPAAVDRYRKAIAAVERIADGFTQRDYRSAFLRDKISFYETLIGLLLARQEKEPAAGFDREAFLYAERSKAQGALAGLRRVESDRKQVRENGRRGEERALAAAISRIQAGMQDPDLTPAALNVQQLRLAKAEAARMGFWLRARTAGGSNRPPSSAALPSIEEIRKGLLDDSTAVLEYVVGADLSCAFLVTRDGLMTAPLPGEGDLRPSVANYLRFLTDRKPRRFQGWAGGQSLRRTLLGPFEDRLKKGIKRLIIVPDGLLHYLPFEALTSGAAGRRFLVEDFEISYAPSAVYLLDLRQRPAPAAYGMDFLGLADFHSVRVRGLAEAGEMRFPPLHYAVGEVGAIGRLFPAGRRTLLMGRAAKESRLKALPLSEYRVIHIAAHGFFEDSRWWRSALLLNRDKNDGEDGFLQPADIESLRFGPELVVLSGCRTGGGLLEKGEGIKGLASSFFYAGARALLLSLWSVNDQATARFMKAFYGYWTGGRSKREALRLAKVEAIRSWREPPFIWAPFVLMGD